MSHEHHDDLSGQMVSDPDECFADFLDWMDRCDDFDQAASGEALVQQFLAQKAYCVTSQVRKELAELVEFERPVNALAATAVWSWIDQQEHRWKPETLPRPFGEYELLEVAGRGGMGVVYKARQTSLQRIVCIKLASENHESRTDLLREARLAGSLHHRGIVTVLDTGVIDGRTFIAMEFVEGQSLAAALANETLSGRDAAELLDSVAAAVEFAHARNVLHRDLKPSNVMLDENGQPRVTDFGLAQRLTPSESFGWQAKGIAGSPSYMAPEQACGNELDVRTDVYGLGAILYEALSGRPPFVGDSPLETIRQVEELDPVPLSRLRPGMPKDLETVCHKCLLKRPQDRYATVGELRDDLKRFQDGFPVRARPLGGLARTVRWIKRNPTVASSAAVVTASLLILISLGAWMFWQTRVTLTVKTQAEESQRELAEDLKIAVALSERSLYRSLIAQAELAWGANDVTSTRRAIDQLESRSSIGKHQSVEFRLLRDRAYPGTNVTLPAHVVCTDFALRGKDQALIVLADDGRLLCCDRHGSCREIAADASDLYDPPSQLAIQSESGRIAVLSERRIQIVDDADSAGRLTIAVNQPIRQIAWHPKLAQLLVISVRGELSLVELSTGQIRPLLFENAVADVAFSADGNHVALIVDGSIAVGRWDNAINEPASNWRSIEVDRWPVDLEWLDAQLIALTEAGTVEVFRTRSGARASGSRETPLSFQPDDPIPLNIDRPRKLLVSGSQLLVVADRECVSLDTERRDFRWRYMIAPSTLIAADRDLIAIQEAGEQQLRLLDRNDLPVADLLEDHGVPIRKIVAGNVGQSVAWRDVDGHIHLVPRKDDFANKTILQEAIQASSGLAMSPTEPLLACSRGSEVVVYRFPESTRSELTQAMRMTAHTETVWAIAFDATGKRLAMGDASGQVSVVDIESGDVLRSWSDGLSEIRDLCFTPDGQAIGIVEAPDHISLRGIATGETIQTWTVDGATINDVQFAEQGVFVGDAQGLIHQCELDSPTPKTSWRAHAGPIWSLLVMDDRVLSAGKDGKIRLWANGEQMMTLADLPSAVWSMCVTGHAQQLFLATTGGEIYRLPLR